MGTFQLRCLDCEFAAVVEGPVDNVYDEIEEHQEEYVSAPRDHAVDFERLDG